MRGATRPAVAPTWRSVDRHVAPATTLLPSASDRLRQQLARARGALGVVGQEAHRDAVAAGGGRSVADRGAEERVRELEQACPAPSPVCGIGARRRRGARGSRAPSSARTTRLVTGHAVEARDERDAARVVLVRRVVEPDCSQ